VFSPSPEQIEYAELLLRRANGDLQACRVLSENTDIDDNIVAAGSREAHTENRTDPFGLWTGDLWRFELPALAVACAVWVGRDDPVVVGTFRG